jgi:hypothetical protein
MGIRETHIRKLVFVIQREFLCLNGNLVGGIRKGLMILALHYHHRSLTEGYVREMALGNVGSSPGLLVGYHNSFH